MKSILQKSNLNPKELLSSFQKDWEILPFPYVVAKPRNLRNGFYSPLYLVLRSKVFFNNEICTNEIHIRQGSPVCVYVLLAMEKVTQKVIKIQALNIFKVIELQKRSMTFAVFCRYIQGKYLAFFSRIFLFRKKLARYLKKF